MEQFLRFFFFFLILGEKLEAQPGLPFLSRFNLGGSFHFSEIVSCHMKWEYKGSKSHRCEELIDPLQMA